MFFLPKTAIQFVLGTSQSAKKKFQLTMLRLGLESKNKPCVHALRNYLTEQTDSLVYISVHDLSPSEYIVGMVMVLKFTYEDVTCVMIYIPHTFLVISICTWR